MRKFTALFSAILLLITLTACGTNGGTTNGTTAETTQTAGETVQAAAAPETKPEPSDTISAGGYTIKVVAVHRTKDSNGKDIAAVELEFTNENSVPASFMRVAQAKLYQNGVQMTSNEMFLENDFNWDSYYTEVKDGGTVSVFRALPLQNAEDPVEVSVDIIDMSKGAFLASTTITLDLVD